jgi:acetyltransferase
MSRDIIHKSDVGGVVLNLTNVDAVRGNGRYLSRARRAPGGADFRCHRAGDGGAPKARELIPGPADDPTFGIASYSGMAVRLSIINDKALALRR